MARLGREQAATQVDVPASAPEVATALGAALAGSGVVVYRPVTLQLGGGVKARMRLLGLDEELAATVAFAARLAAVMLDATPMTADIIEQERARQYLMRAVFDEDGVTPIGTVEEWSHVSITSAVLQPLWIEYGDMRASYDPCADPLPEGEIAMILDAIEKKNAAYLVACGTTTLVRWLLSTDARPAGSPAPKSSPSSDTEPTS